MNCKKRKRKVNKKEDKLPSFLTNLKNQVKPDQIYLSGKKRTAYHLGPLFLGGQCNFHPPYHPISFETLPTVLRTGDREENLLDGILKPEPETENVSTAFKPTFKPNRQVMKKPPTVCTPPAKRQGVRKYFSNKGPKFVVDLGETSSTITGETSQEIQVCRLKKKPNGSTPPEYEFFDPSDLREKKRKFMSKNEWAAHAHFLKRFVKVKVIGPKIPASITITELPSKRKREYNICGSESSAEPESITEDPEAQKKRKEKKAEELDEDKRSKEVRKTTDEMNEGIEEIVEEVKEAIEEIAEEVSDAADEKEDEGETDETKYKKSEIFWEEGHEMSGNEEEEENAYEESVEKAKEAEDAAPQAEEE